MLQPYSHNARKKIILLMLTLIGLVSGLVAGCSLTSALTVPPGKQFALGGNQNGAFTVRLKNVGEVPVVIRERRADGQQVTLGTFQPGDGQIVRFAAGSTALVDNSSAKQARVDLVITGDTNLSMKYSQN